MTVKYTKDHEWVLLEGDIATVGITEHAQEQLGDVVFVDLPESGDSFDAGDEVCVVESVKAASDIFAPLSGEITDANDELDGNPELINQSAESDGWIFKIKISEPSEMDDLMDKTAYDNHIAE